MQPGVDVKRKLESAFPKKQASVLAEVITDAYSELVKTSDFNELKEIVKELAEAQNRTEARVEELAEAQKRTECEVGELAKEMRGLARGQKQLQRQVGGLSNTVGYDLEDKAYPILPALLKRDFGIEVGRLYRRFLVYPDGRDDEVNIYGEGIRNGQRVYVIGEAKAQLGRRDVDSFLRRLKRVREFLDAELIPVLLTYAVHPKVEQYAADKGLKLYWSYDLVQQGI